MKAERALANNIKHYRELRGMTPQALAQRLKVKVQTVYRWERGEGGATFATVAKLAEALGVEETDLLFAGSPPEPVIVRREPTWSDFLDFQQRMGEMRQAGRIRDLMEEMARAEGEREASEDTSGTRPSKPLPPRGSEEDG